MPTAILPYGEMLWPVGDLRWVALSLACGAIGVTLLSWDSYIVPWLQAFRERGLPSWAHMWDHYGFGLFLILLLVFGVPIATILSRALSTIWQFLLNMVGL